MDLNIGNKHRFPHIYELQNNGGKLSPEGEIYYLKNEEEVEKEYEILMQSWAERFKIGNNKIVHGIYNHGQ